MTLKTAPKDVSIRLRGEYRTHLSAIEREWPVSQVDIIGAALAQFRNLAPEQQAEAFRAVAVQSNPRRAALSA